MIAIIALLNKMKEILSINKPNKIHVSCVVVFPSEVASFNFPYSEQPSA